MHAPLEVLKKAFVDGLDYSSKHSGFYLKPNESLSLEQTKQVEAADNYQDLIWKVQIHNFIRTFGYLPPSHIAERDLLRFTGIEVGHTVQTRYIVSGGTDFHRFAITVWACSVCPPHTAEENEIPPEQTLAWYVSGGFTDRSRWYALPEEWLENASYSQYPNHQFIFDGKSEHMHIVFGSPETLQFRLNLIFRDEQDQEHQLLASLQSRARPKYVHSDLPSDVFKQFSFIYCDMGLELTIDQTAEANGLGFVQRIDLLPLSTAFMAQTFLVATLPRTRPYSPVLSLFLQFTSFQYLLASFVQEPFFVGMVISMQGTRYAFDVSSPTQTVQLVVSEIVVLKNRPFPKSVQVLIDRDLGVACAAEAGCALVLNASIQADFQATMEIIDTDNNRGLGLLRVNNVLPVDQWAILSLGDKKWANALVDQPVVRHRPLAIFIVFILPTLVMALLIITVYFSIKTKSKS
jgi:hypothetical protein